jgi:2-hydroxychromene-2-carboxylate isomerase
MGQVIELAQARRRRAGTLFAFDLASPWTYLAADAVAEHFPEAVWAPARGDRESETARERVRAQRAARDLGVRFAWPRRRPEGTAANRAAAAAAEHGRAQAFALAACRLAWGWGDDLDDHGLIAQAAGIANLPLDAILEATFDPRRDVHLDAAAHDGAPALTTAGVVLDAPTLVAAQLSSAAVR